MKFGHKVNFKQLAKQTGCYEYELKEAFEAGLLEEFIAYKKTENKLFEQQKLVSNANQSVLVTQNFLTKQDQPLSGFARCIC